MRDAFAVAIAVPFLVGAALAPADADRDVVFRFADPAIVESSGLTAAGGLVTTVNDSGDSARVFTVDARSGRTVGVTTWDADATDDEALAPAGDGEVWVGDIGDNAAARDEVTVTRVPVGRGDRSVAGESFRLVYPRWPGRRRGAARPPADRPAVRGHQGCVRRQGVRRAVRAPGGRPQQAAAAR